VLFVLFGVVFTETANTVFSVIHSGITHYFGWFYILAVTIFLGFLIWLSLSRYGTIRLGQPYENRSSPLSAGSRCCSAPVWGLGWSTGALPSPYCITRIPEGAGTTIEAARQAMVYSFFHWGLHAWAIYVVLGMSVAYFSFRKQLPLTIRSIFYPMLGDRIYGPIGHLIDILAVFGTLFGLATSLGFGAMQLNTGLHILTGMPVSQWVQVGIIASITAVAVMSVISGLDRGLKWLSLFNLGLAIVLMAFVFIVGPTLFNLRFFLESIGTYFNQLTQMSLSTDAFGNPIGRRNGPSSTGPGGLPGRRS